MSLKGNNFGKMDVLLTIESVTVTKDSNGVPVETFAFYKNCWAQRVKLAGSEIIQANQQNAPTMATYRIRWDSTIVETMRCYENGSTVPYYYIRSVDQWKREGYTQIDAESRDNQ